MHCSVCRLQQAALGEYQLVEGVREAGWPVWRHIRSDLLLYRYNYFIFFLTSLDFVFVGAGFSKDDKKKIKKNLQVKSLLGLGSRPVPGKQEHQTRQQVPRLSSHCQRHLASARWCQGWPDLTNPHYAGAKAAHTRSQLPGGWPRAARGCSRTPCSGRGNKTTKLVDNPCCFSDVRRGPVAERSVATMPAATSR